MAQAPSLPFCFRMRFHAVWVMGLALLGGSLLCTQDASAQTSDLYVGSNSSIQTYTVSGTETYSNTYVGYQQGASNNSLIVSRNTNLLTKSVDLFIGYGGSSNSMVISSGGIVANSNALIGWDTNSSNNSVLVTGTNGAYASTWTNSGDLYVGNSGSGNSLVISNGCQVMNGGSGVIGNNTPNNNPQHQPTNTIRTLVLMCPNIGVRSNPFNL